jgi:hypothetical protein
VTIKAPPVDGEDAYDCVEAQTTADITSSLREIWYRTGTEMWQQALNSQIKRAKANKV